MSTPDWFDDDYYFAQKLAELQAVDSGQTRQKLASTFAQCGFSGERGLFRHFLEYGQFEEVSPNKFFNADQYYTAKAAQYFNTDNVTAEQFQEIQNIIQSAGMNAWSHYNAYGAREGLNPSNAFDAGKYKAAKLQQMRKGNPNASMADLENALSGSGLSPLTHYLLYGEDEDFINDESSLVCSNQVSPPAHANNNGGTNNGGANNGGNNAENNGGGMPELWSMDGESAPLSASLGQVVGFSGRHSAVAQAKFAAPGSNDAATVKLNGATSLRGLFVENIEELTLRLTGTNTLLEDDTPAGVYGNTLQTVFITGDSGASLRVEEIRAGTIDASGLSGSLYIELSDDYASRVVGSSGNDTFLLTDSADVVTGGPGNDVFICTEEIDDHFSSATLLHSVATITDFSQGDSINFAPSAPGISGFAAVSTVRATSESDLTAKIGAHLSGGERAVQLVQYNDKTYVAVNSDPRDTDDDVVVCLAGTFDASSLSVNSSIITAS